MEPMPPDVPTLVARAQAMEKAAPRDALRLLFDVFASEPTHGDALALAARVAKRLAAERETALFEALAQDSDDVQALFDLGYWFVESGLPRVGRAFLERCHAAMPEQGQVAYELAYARCASGEFRGAVPLLERVANDDASHGAMGFAARSLLVQAHVFAHELDAARADFDRLSAAQGDADADAQIDALAQLLARAERMTRKSAYGPREWLFVAHGAALLHVARNERDPLPAFTAGLDWLAGMLRRLESLLAAVDVVPGRVQWINDSMMPLALALAERIGAEPGAYRPDHDRQTLVMLKDPRDAQAVLEELQSREEGSDTFALSLDPRLSYSICPELVGQFATSVRLPWEERFEFSASSAQDARLAHVERDTRSAEALADELIDSMIQLEGDEGDRKTLNRWYVPQKDLLLLGNYGAHPARRVFTPRPGA
jgi:hypothetical protein